MELAVFLCLLALAAVSEVLCQTTSTKKTYCEICVQHTMCIFPDESVKSPGYLSEGVTNKDVNLILKMHNHYRSLVASGNATRGLNGTVQPPAANMRRMIWDPELATIAQRWANQCTWGHDTCRAVNRFPVGQNAYTASRTKNVAGADFAPAIDAWYIEIDLFNGNTATSFEFDGAIAHYTQLVWADTFLVGCGYTYYDEKPWYTKLYICNYGPTGNWKGEGLYIVGEAGSQCPSGTIANTTDGLCWRNTTKTSETTTTSAPALAKGLAMSSTTVSVKMNEMTCTCTTPVAKNFVATTPFSTTPVGKSPKGATKVSTTTATTAASVDPKISDKKKKKIKKEKVSSHERT